MKKITTSVLLILLLFVSTLAAAQHGHESHEPAGKKEQVPPELAVKHEMHLLDAAFKNLLDAIVLNAPETIEAPFHAVHTAKMATEKALHSGKVKLPKNGDKLDEFVELDEAFHGKLKKLLGAAKRKDSKEIQNSAHEILDSCVECHARFRE